MNANITKFIKSYNSSVFSVNQLLVSTFVESNGLDVPKNSLLYQYLSHDVYAVDKFRAIINKVYGSFGFEELIMLFEFVVSPVDKLVTGAVYTPKKIREHIVKHVLTKLSNVDWSRVKIADISCGCGGFFLTLIEAIQEMSNRSCVQIISQNIYGIDIESYSIERTKILLALYALSKGETISDDDFHLFVSDSLEKKLWNEGLFKDARFDAIIGNPPYVTSSKISENSKALLKDWSVTETGKSDLYIPFFQIGYEALNENGILGYITVNNFYRSLNGRALREYLCQKECSISLIDFGGEKIFRGCSAYTCLCFISKSEEPKVHYTHCSSSNLNKLNEDAFSLHDFSLLDNKKGWRLRDKETLDFINNVEKVGTPLFQVVDIRNGIATLKNEVYILNVVGETPELFIHNYKGVDYCIEKTICRDIIKPSKLNYDKSVDNQIQHIIFPYQESKGKKKCIAEETFKKYYPFAYKYILSQKSVLEGRDKGNNKNYETWFAYGRSQSLTLSGYRLFMPYISMEPKFALSEQDSLLFYNGFAVISKKIEDLRIIQKVLNSDIFWHYVKSVSKPYGGNFYSLGKRYIKHFGIPNFSSEQKQELLKIETQSDVNIWLRQFYRVPI